MLNVIRSTEYYVPGVVFWSYTLIRHISTRFTHSDKRDLLSNVIKLIEAANQLWQANILQSSWNPPKHQQKSYPFSQGTNSFAKLLVFFLTVSRVLCCLFHHKLPACVFVGRFVLLKIWPSSNSGTFHKQKTCNSFPASNGSATNPKGSDWRRVQDQLQEIQDRERMKIADSVQGSWNYLLLGAGDQRMQKIYGNFVVFHFPLLVHCLGWCHTLTPVVGNILNILVQSMCIGQPGGLRHWSDDPASRMVILHVI